MSFIHDDFLLQTDAARELYHNYAKDEPIYDYHCHLPPQDVANNRRFSDLAEIWLEGDHYKWRAMRSNGVSEAYCTGEADPYDKFLAWCRTVPHTLRNPLYHWSHLELKRYFDIDVLISEDTAKEIWDAANEKLKSDDLSAHGILKNFKVKVVGTTDDPTDDLANHAAIRDQGLDTKVVPTFRPDKALNVDRAEAFNAWVDKLAGVVGSDISSLADLLAALKARHSFFHEMGGRLSDHGLERCYFAETSEQEVSAIFDKARSGSNATEAEKEAFAFYVMREVGRWNAERGWTMQLHVGAIRNNNSRMFRSLGPDTGFDSIGDFPQVRSMSRFLDSLDTTGQLPKTVIYNLNWSDNYAMATMLGNFQDGTVAGKIQLGSGWWFLDQKEGMIAQMNALSNLGLLSRFVGMLTDSRSFLSYPRHEYFRRILCDLLGQDMVSGEIPHDMDLVGGMVKNICFGNANEYFGVLK
ncbi:glucuronate isomerase [Pelagicoccus sp. SDUM812005]|uniref:glucuronate isomerase n=1 Tax=Pelagicoccus sp. SDUM812005 TaxID=3041257 RepID=UPI00280CB936|nr:glucuronate isomerase [Pelagicoccus sp. SDUM812005]MDQ8179221.1 glucuronate isomerase [Pelagicoccus sp. SDUM812005]